MVIDLKDIHKIRKKIDITQKDLARLAGVSQSLIAKVEAGTLDPSYSNARRIIEAIDDASKQTERDAADVMEKRIRSLKPTDSIQHAIILMKRYEISQMPVIENTQPVGYISESIILRGLIDKHYTQVQEIMEEAPPIISKQSRLSIVSELLKYYEMVLVSDKGKFVGIITRADVIRKL